MNTNMELGQKWTKPPAIGMRMFKTAVAVFLCFVVYLLRGKRGMPVNAAVTAIICMQQYVKDSKTLARNRIWGTLIGAAYGLAVLLVLDYFGPFSYEIVQYVWISLALLLVLYSTVLMKKADAATLACVIFLVITVNYPETGNPWEQVYHRLVDTLIGIGLAIFVNCFHLPKERHGELLFLVELESLIQYAVSELPGSIRIGMNHLLADGAKVAFVTWRAPAFLIEKLKDVNIKVPVIVMDGAALYEIQENRYVDKVVIPTERVNELTAYLKERGITCLVYSIMQSTLLIYYEAFRSEMEQQNYERMKKSPYRNYIQGAYHAEDEIVAVRVMDTDEEIAHLEEELQGTSFAQQFRIVRREQEGYEGYAWLYFYDKEATRERMAEKLRRLMGAREIELIGTEWEGKSGIAIKKPTDVVKYIRRLFEPIRGGKLFYKPK